MVLLPGVRHARHILTKFFKLRGVRIARQGEEKNKALPTFTTWTSPSNWSCWHHRRQTVLVGVDGRKSQNNRLVTASLFFLLSSSRASRTFRAPLKMTRSSRLPHKAPVMQARHDHAIRLFFEADVLPMTFLYYESVSILMHDISNDKAPANMLNLFQKTSKIYSYNTRLCTSGKFYVKSTTLEIQNNSFSCLGVKLWNEIPRNITDLPKETFKRVLCKLLFDILEKEDDYVHIPVIIKLFSLCR